METNKAVSNSAFRLATALSLIIGLTILSFSGNPFKLAGEPNIDPEQVPEIKSGDLEDNHFAKMARDQAQKEFRNMNRTNNQNITIPENKTFIDKMALGLLKSLAQMGLMPGNMSQQQSENLNKTLNNTTDPINQTNTTDPINRTIPKNQTQEETPETNQTNNEPDEPSEPEEPTQENRTEQQEQNQNQSKKQGSEALNLLKNNFKYLILLLALIASAITLFIVKKSDYTLKETLDKALKWLKKQVKTLPDLFTRIITSTTDLILNQVKRIAYFAKKLYQKPKETLRKTFKTLKTKTKQVRNNLNQFKNKGITGSVDKLLEKPSQSYTGLAATWYKLKATIGVENDKTLTPEEIRRKAIEKRTIPEKTVDKIVDIFRREKYSSKGYQGNQNLKELEKDLEKEDDE